MQNQDSSFQYSYDKVFDAYVIEAWRDQPERPPAYTPQMVERHSHLLGRLSCVNPTRSGDSQMIIGQTPGWPKNPDFPDDPEIPPQNIYAYQITEAPSTRNTIKMIFSAGSHATEFTGNWMLEGVANFVAGNDPAAISLRRQVTFFFYPDINPEGRYLALRHLNLQAAPDPNAGTNMRHRGNPQLYAAGIADNNRVWNTEGKFKHIDIIKNAMQKDTGGKVDYLWDLHGPQEPGNWRSPQGESAWNCDYGKALQAREPKVLIAGLPGGFKGGLSFDLGKLSVWALSNAGLKADYSYVYEPGGWTEMRLKEAGRNLALALYDVLNGNGGRVR